MRVAYCVGAIARGVTPVRATLRAVRALRTRRGAAAMQTKVVPTTNGLRSLSKLWRGVAEGRREVLTSPDRAACAAPARAPRSRHAADTCPGARPDAR